MSATKVKNLAYFGLESEVPNTYTDGVPITLLIQIRDELRKLNHLLHCHNFTDIPHKLDRIRFNTTKRKKKQKARLRAVA